MPSQQKAAPLRSAGKIADLAPDYLPQYWSWVEECLREVFHKSKAEIQQAVQRSREGFGKAPDDEALMLYHTSPLQLAAILAGVTDRPLTADELLAYAKLQNRRRADRPSPDEILQAHVSDPRKSMRTAGQ